MPRPRLSPTYPQDAQRAVEMLIIQRSQIAAFSCRRTLAGCPERPYIPSCAERGAGVGRSSTGRSYEAARKGRSGKSTGAVDETATGSANFFGPFSCRRSPLSRPGTIARCTLLGRRASTRESSLSFGPSPWRLTSTSASSRSARAAPRRSCWRSSPSRESGFSCVCGARTRQCVGAPAGRARRRSYAARRSGRCGASAERSIRASSLPS